MLEKPEIPDELVTAALQGQYRLKVAELTFLPLGADSGTAVYRVLTVGGKTYFLKLRKAFEEISVKLPLFLNSQGIREVIPPIETKSDRAWGDFGEYKTILYPFIHGHSGFERELTDDHRHRLGAALTAIHALEVPPELERLIPKDSFAGQWCEKLKSFLAQIQETFYSDVTAARLAEFMRFQRRAIEHLIERTQELARELASMPLEQVLCHTDIHGGNILIGDKDELYIVDWDNPRLAPKERDLMFIGGGIDTIWKSKREERVFYRGYGKADINVTALAYYRYARVIEDLAITCEQLLLTDEGGADREQAYRWFTGNFEPGSTIEIAEMTDQLWKTACRN